MEKPNMDLNEIVRQEALLERKRRVEDGFELDNEVSKYIDKYLSAIDEIKEIFVKAAENLDDDENIILLTKEIKLKIEYLRPKSRDTEDDMVYIGKLELLHEKLSELIKQEE